MDKAEEQHVIIIKKKRRKRKGKSKRQSLQSGQISARRRKRFSRKMIGRLDQEDQILSRR